MDMYSEDMDILTDLDLFMGADEMDNSTGGNREEQCSSHDAAGDHLFGSSSPSSEDIDAESTESAPLNKRSKKSKRKREDGATDPRSSLNLQLYNKGLHHFLEGCLKKIKQGVQHPYSGVNPIISQEAFALLYSISFGLGVQDIGLPTRVSASPISPSSSFCFLVGNNGNNKAPIRKKGKDKDKEEDVEGEGSER